MASEQGELESDRTTRLAAELDAIRRRVVNVVGHELRTPVTTIHGMAAELAHAEDIATVREVLAPGILRNAERLTRLLDDLLIAAGISTAIPAGEVQRINLAAEASAIWVQVSTRRLDIPDEGWVVLATREVVERSVRAILENAAVYGTDLPQIEFGLEDDPAADGPPLVTMTVLSPGPPIHAEEARLGVEPFFRGERAVTTKPGLGMGLSIAREVAIAGGGWLTFDATDSGTRTVLALPGRSAG